MKMMILLTLVTSFLTGCTNGYEPSSPCGQYGTQCFYKIPINQ